MTDVQLDPEWGFLRLDPVPEDDELAGFYESAYYDLLRGGARAPDLARLIAGGPEAETERGWLAQTVHRDYMDWAIDHVGDTGSVLEVGCGTGDLLASFSDRGWQATGLELATAVVEHARGRGLDVRCQALGDYANETSERFDVVVMRFLLEHVPDPVRTLRDAQRVLGPGGVLIVEVPNDFNPLQLSAVETHGLNPWWIAVPDHVNYFDFESLTTLLERLGYRIEQRSTSFPMELFLLMGEVYVGDPEVGARCHQRRRALETSLPAEVRRRLYASLAEAGLGRSCIVVARST